MDSGKNVSVIGLGYIGLPTAALLATHGYHVAGMDVNRSVVDVINRGEIHIVEPDLDAYVRSAVVNEKLYADTQIKPADIYVICVPTPFFDGEGIPVPNVEHVIAAARSITPLLKSGDLIILESTSPVGTTEQIAELIEHMGVDLDSIHIAYCPERVLPGKIMTELVENDRVVGGLTPASTGAVAEFYRTFVHGEVLETTAKTAEMCKLTENSFRDVNIAFANELSVICEKEGINAWQLIALANRHPRVDILRPGTGVGGHCIAVDPWFIVARDTENAKLIRTAREVNNYKTEWVIERIKIATADVHASVGRTPKIACLGLAFKPDIDDLRESPAVEVALSLVNQGYQVVAVEPNVQSHDLISIVDFKSALADADVLAILVNHKEFTTFDFKSCESKLKILDFCGVIE